MSASLSTLAILARLRQRELDAARDHLAVRLGHEATAAARVREAVAALRKEQELAASIDAADAAVEAFAAWLPVGRGHAAIAEHDLTEAEGATAQARFELTAARGAAEAATQMHDARLAAIRAERDRKLQAELDDCGRRGRR